MTEVWKPIPGYRDYEASSDGRIRSLDSALFIKSPRGPCFTVRKKRGKILAPAFNPRTGYKHVVLGRGELRTVHQLVAEAFLGPRPKGYDTCHLNGDRTDNRAVNFMYGTRSENFSHMVAHGTRMMGESHYNSKITSATAKAIYDRCHRGERVSELASEFGLAQSAVSHIKSGRHWASVTQGG